MNSVQHKEILMNTIITSKEAILKISRNIIINDGASSLSIRKVASACNVSVGSIYNYYESKSELLAATIESIWSEIFHQNQSSDVFNNISECITWLYDCLKYGNNKYPEFFSVHSIGFTGNEKADGKQRMYNAWEHILSNLRHVLLHDPDIRDDAFNSEFTPDKYANMIFSLIISDTMKKDYNPDFILEIIKRTLY